MREYAALLERHIANIKRQDYHAALICAVLANINRDPQKKPDPFTPADFMPSLAVPEKEEEGEALDHILKLAGDLGAEVIVNDG